MILKIVSKSALFLFLNIYLKISVETFGCLSQKIMDTLDKEFLILLALVLTDREYATGSCWWVNKSGVHLDKSKWNENAPGEVQS